MRFNGWWKWSRCFWSWNIHLVESLHNKPTSIHFISIIFFSKPASLKGWWNHFMECGRGCVLLACGTEWRSASSDWLVKYGTVTSRRAWFVRTSKLFFSQLLYHSYLSLINVFPTFPDVVAHSIKEVTLIFFLMIVW